jgi:DNA-binding beta-propeller fold protein YncE
MRWRCEALLTGVRVWPLLVAWLSLSGCGSPWSQPELVYGKRGTHAGEFIRPRAAAIDAQDHIYIVDYTARVQVFDRDGHYLHRGWTTPDSSNGRPSGLSIDRDGNLLLSDSHYHCLRIYSPEGIELKRIGGEDGTALGQFSYVCDAVQDQDGYYYVGEYGRNARITKLDPEGKPLVCWGEPGTAPGQFSRIRALVLGPDGYLYVADACNDRIQVFNPKDGSLVRCWGTSGSDPGQLKYPYDLAFGPKGELYVIEYGNHRVQKFTAEGVALGCWGGVGREPGQFLSPWALVVDSEGKVHVIDSENHRVQRIAF